MLFKSKTFWSNCLKDSPTTVPLLYNYKNLYRICKTIPHTYAILYIFFCYYYVFQIVILQSIMEVFFNGNTFTTLQRMYVQYVSMIIYLFGILSLHFY